MSEDVKQWLEDHKGELVFETIEPLNEKDFETYKRFEQNRYHEDDQYEFGYFDIVTLRVKEYRMDSKDYCFCCGYFEPNEVERHGYGYCFKMGEDTNPLTRACDTTIIL